MSMAPRDEAAEFGPTSPPRIEALATLPLFFKLSGKRVLVAGGSEAALWKAELLAASGATVDVIAENFCHGFNALTSDRLRLHPRRWVAGDIEGAAIAIGAMTTDDEAGAFAGAARAASVPVNVIDRPAYCDFQFGAIANRSPLIIAISTDGAAPVLGQVLRSNIEMMLPDSIREWVAAAARWRQDLEERDMGLADRRAFWGRFANLAFEQGARLPTEQDFTSLLAGERDLSALTIVALATSEVESLTLGAIRALRTADAVVHDEDVAAAVLDFARREALRVPVSGDATGLLVKLAGEGKRVVRIRLRVPSSPQDQETETENLKLTGLTLRILPPAQ